MEYDFENPRLLIVGAGAIGGVCAGFLTQSGYHVDLITKHEELAFKIQTEGIQVLSPHGQFQIKIPAFPNMEK